MTSIHSSLEYQPITECISQDIYNEEKDQIVCHIKGYRQSRKIIFYYMFHILLIGLPYMIFKFYPKLKCQFKYKQCAITDAQLFLVRDNHGNYSEAKVETTQIRLPHLAINDHIKFFFHQHTKYVWIADSGSFGTLKQLLWFQITCDDYLNDMCGLAKDEYCELFKLYGPNKIEIKIKSYWKLFIEEIFNPFYVFQAFSVVLWLVDDYVIYASCVVVLTLLSSTTSLIETRKQSENLHSVVESSKSQSVTVLRKNSDTESHLVINPEDLVPGDLIVMASGDFVMPCDAVLLTGQCIVNESVLTGESVPITKVALTSSHEVFTVNAHKRNTLFSGTYVLQTRYYGGEKVLARVIGTSFDTTRGDLVKSIMFPSPVNLQFYKDSLKFVLVLFTIAASGMAYVLYLYVERHASVKELTVRTLDIITIVVPPALPAAMAVGTMYSQGRLKKLKIFCNSPPRINVCGKIKLACFDKTGTLTHDGLSINSVIPCNNGQFSDPMTDSRGLDDQDRFLQGMASCHSLTRIGGKLNGDPLDVNMFEFTNWNLEEPGSDENTRYDMLAPTVVTPSKKENSKLSSSKEQLDSDQIHYQIGIIREFPFSSTLQCMSVICKDLATPYMYAFCKGAPEKIYGLCKPETLPEDFQSKLSFYTVRGYRVIALAHKNLPKKFKWKDAQKAQRSVIECDLNFIGLVVMQNPLKNETIPVIQELHRANIRTVMITGDNIMTAISVARDCGMVNTYDNIYVINVRETENVTETPPSISIEKAGSGPQTDSLAVNIYDSDCHFAMDGKTWSKLVSHYEHMIPRLLVRTTIFARFQPDQKTQIVTSLQELDYVVSMVGDGANDCGALKAADVGVSLSPAEASVAAPFTSAIPNISCLIFLILEGRCALVTNFATFKYMALYSLIQFFSILILYKCHSILGDFQFLYIDLIITTVLAVTMGYQGPAKALHRKRPLSSLVSAKNIIPLLLQIVACAFFQLAALYYLYRQDWFEPISSDAHGEVIVSWENTVIFTISCYQYIILAYHFSKGQPHRKPTLTNVWLLLSIISLTLFTTLMMIDPCKELAKFMDLVYLTHKEFEKRRFRYLLLLFPVGHFIIAGMIEKFMGDRPWLQKVVHFIFCKKKSKNKYKRLLQEENFAEYFSSLRPICE